MKGIIDSIGNIFSGNNAGSGQNNAGQGNHDWSRVGMQGGIPGLSIQNSGTQTITHNGHLNTGTLNGNLSGNIGKRNKFVQNIFRKKILMTFRT